MSTGQTELALECPRAGEQTAVDCVYNRGRVDHPPTKVSAIKTLDGVFTTLNLVKLEVDVAFRVGINRDVNHMAVSALGFIPHLVFEFLDPAIAFLPTTQD